MGEIKSAREIADEKLGQIEAPTEEERLHWKYVPEGEKLAAEYIKEGIDLSSAIEKFGDKARKHVTSGALSVLVHNISLPTTEIIAKNNEKAISGIRLLKPGGANLETILGQLKNIFDHYSGPGQQQRQQAYESLKAELEMQVRQALQKQMGTANGIPIDVEKQPQFQSEWRRRQTQLDAQYLNLLSELKQKLLDLA